jgi:hypothetical protein
VNRAKTIRSEEARAALQRSVSVESEIDHILATEEELIPSSGFLASVMERVQKEAALPAPIAFPWKRAVPGILVIAGVFAWGAVDLIRSGPALPGIAQPGIAAPSWLTPVPLHLSAAAVPPVESAGWVALALGASLASWLLSRRLAGRGGLF